MKNKLLSLSLFCLSLQACQDDVYTNVLSSTTRSVNNVPNGKAQLSSYEYDVSKMAAKLQLFQKQKPQEYIPLITQNEEAEYFFVVVKNQFNPNKIDGDYFQQAGAVGLYNENKKLILPIAYQSIGNINSLAKGWMEVRQGNRWGLFQPSKGILTAIEYDLIYPYNLDDKVLVQVRRGNQYGWLDNKGKAYFDPNSHTDKRLFQSPIQSGLAKEWAYSRNKNNILPFVQSRLEDLEMDEEFGYACIAMTPMYWQNLGVCQPNVSFRTLPTEMPGEGIHDGEIRIKEIKKTNGFSAIVAALEESGVAGRTYHLEQDAVVVMDQEEQKKGIEKMPRNNAEVCKGEEHLRFLSNRLIEVRRMTDLEIGEYPFAPYKEMLTYRYYEINAQGQVKQLDSPRFFDCTKYVKMDPSYFAGCHAAMDNNRPVENGVMHLLLREYVSPDDLDLMRNEIYAEYGLKFKTEKWKKYFNQQPWYQPRHDNVDDKLTEIDKHNIQVILQMKTQMEKDPKRYQKTVAKLHQTGI